MSAGTLIILFVIGGMAVAMFVMRRRGQSHAMGMGGHDHGPSPESGRADAPQNEDSQADGSPGSTRRRGGCC